MTRKKSTPQHREKVNTASTIFEGCNYKVLWNSMGSEGGEGELQVASPVGSEVISPPVVTITDSDEENNGTDRPKGATLSSAPTNIDEVNSTPLGDSDLQSNNIVSSLCKSSVGNYLADESQSNKSNSEPNINDIPLKLSEGDEKTTEILANGEVAKSSASDEVGNTFSNSIHPSILQNIPEIPFSDLIQDKLPDNQLEMNAMLDDEDEKMTQGIGEAMSILKSFLRDQADDNSNFSGFDNMDDFPVVDIDNMVASLDQSITTIETLPEGKENLQQGSSSSGSQSSTKQTDDISRSSHSPPPTPECPAADPPVVAPYDVFPPPINFLATKIKIEPSYATKATKFLKNELKITYDVLLNMKHFSIKNEVASAPEINMEVEEREGTSLNLSSLNVPLCCVKVERLPLPVVEKGGVAMSDRTFKSWKREITNQRNDEKFQNLKVWRRGRTLLWRECELDGMDAATYNEQVAYIKKHKVSLSSDSEGDSSDGFEGFRNLRPRFNAKLLEWKLIQQANKNSDEQQKLKKAAPKDKYVVENNSMDDSELNKKKNTGLKITIRKTSIHESGDESDKSVEKEPEKQTTWPKKKPGRNFVTKRTYRKPDPPVDHSKKPKFVGYLDDNVDNRSLLGTRSYEVENDNLLEKWDIPFETPTLFRSPRVASKMAQIKNKEAFKRIYHRPTKIVKGLSVNKDVKDVMDMLCTKTVESILAPDVEEPPVPPTTEPTETGGINNCEESPSKDPTPDEQVDITRTSPVKKTRRRRGSYGPRKKKVKSLQSFDQEVKDVSGGEEAAACASSTSTQVPVVSEGPGQSPHNSEEDLSKHKDFSSMESLERQEGGEVVTRVEESVAKNTSQDQEKKLPVVTRVEQSTDSMSDKEKIPPRVTRSRKLALQPIPAEPVRASQPRTTPKNESSDETEVKVTRRSSLRRNTSLSSQSLPSNTQVDEVSEGPGESGTYPEPTNTLEDAGTTIPQQQEEQPTCLDVTTPDGKHVSIENLTELCKEPTDETVMESSSRQDLDVYVSDLSGGNEDLVIDNFDDDSTCISILTSNVCASVSSDKPTGCDISKDNLESSDMDLSEDEQPSALVPFEEAKTCPDDNVTLPVKNLLDASVFGFFGYMDCTAVPPPVSEETEQIPQNDTSANITVHSTGEKPGPEPKTVQSIGEKPGVDLKTVELNSTSEISNDKTNSIDERTGLPTTLIQKLRDPRIRSKLLSKLDLDDSSQPVAEVEGSSVRTPHINRESLPSTVEGNRDLTQVGEKSIEDNEPVPLPAPLETSNSLLENSENQETEDEEDSIKKWTRKPKKTVDVELVYKTPLVDPLYESDVGYSSYSRENRKDSFERTRGSWYKSDDRKTTKSWRDSDSRDYKERLSRGSQRGRDTETGRSWSRGLSPSRGSPSADSKEVKSHERSTGFRQSPPIIDQSCSQGSNRYHHPPPGSFHPQSHILHQNQVHTTPQAWDPSRRPPSLLPTPNFPPGGYNNSRWSVSQNMNWCMPPPNDLSCWKQWDQQQPPTPYHQPEQFHLPENEMDSTIRKMNSRPKTDMSSQPLTKLYSYYNKWVPQVLNNPPFTFNPNEAPRSMIITNQLGQERTDLVHIPTSGLTDSYFDKTPADCTSSELCSNPDIPFHLYADYEVEMGNRGLFDDADPDDANLISTERVKQIVEMVSAGKSEKEQPKSSADFPGTPENLVTPVNEVGLTKMETNPIETASFSTIRKPDPVELKEVSSSTALQDILQCLPSLKEKYALNKVKRLQAAAPPTQDHPVEPIVLNPTVGSPFIDLPIEPPPPPKWSVDVDLRVDQKLWSPSLPKDKDLNQLRAEIEMTSIRNPSPPNIRGNSVNQSPSQSRSSSTSLEPRRRSSRSPGQFKGSDSRSSRRKSSRRSRSRERDRTYGGRSEKNDSYRQRESSASSDSHSRSWERKSSSYKSSSSRRRRSSRSRSRSRY